MDIITFTTTAIGLVLGYVLGAFIIYSITTIKWKHEQKKEKEKISKNRKNDKIEQLNYNEEQNTSL